MAVAYLANIFPSPVEPYVIQETRELRKRGICVIPCSPSRTSTELSDELKPFAAETVHLQPLRLGLLARAAFICASKFSLLKDLFRRALRKKTPAERRLRTLLHTFMGAYYAVLLEKRAVTHIHVHHGYFGAWVAMVAARLLEIDFSMTLHGSDLLLHAAYLDTKLAQCQFCVTISEFNRRHILEHYPEADPAKVFVRRMGVDCNLAGFVPSAMSAEGSPLEMLAVGRLHPVKDHAFLVWACRVLKSSGLRLRCAIAGEGPERPSLERLIRDLDLENEVRLLGELQPEVLHERYEQADLVVLTSSSEGIPLVLMEAMAHGKVVVAPAITGISELVLDGVTGFLYRAGSLDDFVKRVELIHRSRFALDPLRRKAREHVIEHFNRKKNVAAFCDLLVSSLHTSQAQLACRNPAARETCYENPILQ